MGTDPLGPSHNKFHARNLGGSARPVAPQTGDASQTKASPKKHRYVYERSDEHRLGRRFLHTPHGKRVVHLAADHPAVVEGRTLFPTTVVDPRVGPRVLKSGANQRKIGDRVTKGRWKGMRIYTLTLEERKTCPATCAAWRTCYGNKMNWSPRMMHGAVLETRLAAELAALQAQHPDGFVVRLHILGDFYSLGYVRQWARWLDEFPALHVFGYSAWRLNTPIGLLLRALSAKRWDRFAMRFSGTGLRERSAIVVRAPLSATVVDGAVVCPAQTERVSACGACGLCWGTRRNIAFLEH